MIDLQVPFLFKASSALGSSDGVTSETLVFKSTATVSRPLIAANNTHLICEVVETGKSDPERQPVRFWKGRYWRRFRSSNSPKTSAQLGVFRAILDVAIEDSPYGNVALEVLGISAPARSAIKSHMTVNSWLELHGTTKIPEDFTSNESQIEAAIKSLPLLLLDEEDMITAWVETEVPNFRIEYYSDTGLTIGAVFPKTARNLDDDRDHWRATERTLAEQEAQLQAGALGLAEPAFTYTHDIVIHDLGLIQGRARPFAYTQPWVSSQRPAGLDFRA